MIKYFIEKYNINILLILVDECKKRWKNIKNTYKTHKRNRKLGTELSANNKPTKWVLADSLSFLDVVSNERTLVIFNLVYNYTFSIIKCIFCLFLFFY